MRRSGLHSDRRFRGGLDVLGTLAAHRQQLRSIGTNLGEGRLDARLLREGAHLTELIGGCHGHDGSGCACASSTTGTVGVGLVLGGRINVHDEFDIVDVNAAGRDIGGYEHARAAVLEGCEISIAR
jgi:hypothetical protein